MNRISPHALCKGIITALLIALAALPSQAQNHADDPVIASLTAVIRATPNDPVAYNQRGATYAAKRDFNSATQDFLASINADPNYAPPFVNLGLIRQIQGDFEQAFDLFTRAASVDPTYARAFLARADLVRNHLDHATYPQALEDYDRGAQIAPDDPVIVHNRGLLFQTQNDHVRAIEDFTDAISLNPRVAETFNARGISRAALNDTKGALDDFVTAIEINSNYVAAWTNRGKMLAELGEKERAEEAFSAALIRAPNDPDARAALTQLRQSAP